ncbi:MAG: transcriptional repressor [Anaerolineae bacterium]|nr:transcriptional repressor [Anaerolineae bacterium]
MEELHQRGLRVTPQREMVLAALHELEGHLAVEEVYERVHAQSASVDKTTVYRTLDLMHDLGLVHTVDLGDGVLRYELAMHEPHTHLLCTRCGRLLTVRCAILDPLAERLGQEFGFELDQGHQVIRGLCASCRRQRDGLSGEKEGPELSASQDGVGKA